MNAHKSLGNALALLMTALLAVAPGHNAFGAALNDTAYSEAIDRDFRTNSLSAFPLPPADMVRVRARTNVTSSISFTDAPLEMVLPYYADISGMHYSVTNGVSKATTITYHSEERLTDEQSLRIINRLLFDKGISLTQVSEHEVTVHPTSASTVPASRVTPAASASGAPREPVR